MYYYNTAGQLLETQYYQGATQVWSKQIIWLGSLPLAQVTQNATGSEMVYLHADHLNTPRKATNDQQQVVWQWSSDAYGNGAANEDVDGDQQLTQIDLRFPGQLFDAESGLYYNYYRYYDPKTGRYITSDPIGLAGGINTFAYVGGNPMMYYDHLGLSQTDIRRLKGEFDKKVEDMTKRGERTHPWWNNVPRNLSGYLFNDWSYRAGDNYKQCFEQANDLAEHLRQFQEDNVLDDNWEFIRNWERGVKDPHHWLEGHSDNSSDPIIFIDPFDNTFKEVP